MPNHTEEEKLKRAREVLARGNIIGQQAAKISGKSFTPTTFTAPTPSPTGAPPSPPTGTTPSGATINTITGELLAPAPTPVVAQVPPVITPSIQGDSIPVTEPQKVTPEVGSEFTKELDISIARLLGKETEAAKRVTERVTPLETQLGEINKQIKMLQSQDLAIEAEAEKRGVLQPFAEGEAARAKRQNAIEVLKLSAQAEGIRGDITLAERQIKRAVDLEFVETERDIRIKRQNVIANYDSFTPAQKKRADALLLELDRQDAFVAEQKKNKEEIGKIVVKGAEAGADNPTLKRAEQAGTAIEAAQILAPFLAKKEFAPGDVGEFQRIHGRTPTPEEFFEFQRKQRAEPAVPSDIQTFKSFFPNVDITTPAGQQQYLNWKARVEEAERKGEEPPITKATPEDRRTLIGGGLTDIMISNIEEGVRTIGIDAVLKDDYTDTQKVAIRKVYGVESKEITNAQLLQAAQAMKQADVENFFNARYTEDEINKFAKEAGFARFFKKRATERADYFASPKARKKLAELLGEQYKQQGFTIK